MILVELELTNYKQFYGTHRFTPPPQGIIGVIGRNGVGKTTLFEAIEWCLYAPRSIGRDEIPPRGKPGHTRVKVVLQDIETGIDYVVERTLKGGANKVQNAEIYRADQPDSRIVHGSAATRAYVAGKLIGLGHTAFVSTFFTRQKELSFFGSLSALERRREIERLLGFETIREAQQSIGEERTKAGNEASFLRAQHQQEIERRNLVEERDQATERLATAREEQIAATLALDVARSNVARTRSIRENLLEKQQRDNALANELTRLSGELSAREATREAIAADLQQIAEAREECDRLIPVAEQVESLERRLQVHEREAERHRNAMLIESLMADCGLSLDRVAEQMAGAVKAAPAPFVSEWQWTPVAPEKIPAAAERLLAVIDDLDIDDICDRAVAFESALERQRHHASAMKKVEQYQQRLAALQAEREQIVAAGDPEELVKAAASEREAAQREASGAATEAKNARDRLAEVNETIGLLRAEQRGDICPTCGQTIDRRQRAIILESLTAQADQLATKQREALAMKSAAETRATEAGARLAGAEERRAKLTELSGRIANGTSMLPDAENEARETSLLLQEVLEQLGLESPPSPDFVAKAKQEADALQRMQRQAPLLRSLQQQATEQLQKRDQAKTEREALGPISYDAAAHEADGKALDAARTAATTIAELNRRIARESDLQARLQETEQLIAAAKAELERVTAEREKLGFNRDDLEAAEQAEKEALDEERAASTAAHQATTAVSEAENRLAQIDQEEARLAQMLVTAEEKQRLSEDLTQMYRAFERFGGYVSRTVTPDLAEHTSDLIAEATEGKYDRIDFDESFGIQVYDGDESFPMEHFSGGERDVIALSARLALSQLIGSQASRPPRFLVLDEVFGSLDRDRRENVLGTLGALVTATDAFRQLFVITHVDDVRASPIFDQIWRVSESHEGVSDLRDITDDTRTGEDG